MNDLGVDQLSEREQEILILVASGAGNKAIAQQLSISANTVKVHLHNIFNKIGANSRTEAAVIAIRAGLYQPAGLPDQGELPNATENPAASIASEQTDLPAASQPSTSRRIGAGILTGVALIALIIFGVQNALRATQPPTATAAANPNFQWETAPAPPGSDRLPAAAVAGSVIYLVGGENTAGVSNRLQRLDPETASWEALPGKPSAAADFQAAILGGKLYAPGGRGPTGKLLSTLEVFSLETGEWAAGANLPFPVSRFALAVAGDALYLFGGWDGSRYLNTVLRYLPAQDTWETLPPMPQAASDMAAIISQGGIHLLGGTRGGQALAETWVFTPGENGGEWQPGEPLPASSQHLCAATILDFTYLFTFAASQPPAENAWQHTGEQPGWFLYPLPPASLDGCTAFAVGSRLFLLSPPAEPGGSAQLLSIRAIYTTHIPNVRQPEK